MMGVIITRTRPGNKGRRGRGLAMPLLVPATIGPLGEEESYQGNS